MIAIELLLFTLVLSIDSFSAAIALGLRHFSARRAFFFALSSGLSEGLAIALGFLLGHFAQSLITQYDHWLAFALLVLVGGHMCYRACMDMKSRGDRGDEVKVHGLLKILFVSSVTSIDSLGVGISLGLVNKPIALYSLVVGIGAFAATYSGLFLAKKLSSRFGEKIEFMGGAVLIALGIKMLSI
ncbi:MULTISPECIES: manganese efflux pump MntP family protein [Aphanothece]|uniref:manganese efflux pump MntP n=1 Tax=Aphanothece TaxID=1121 RepID=UPI003984F72B